ncbi:MAG: hypothetical protein R8L53_05130 [Mariprofundales bacterium]
MLLANVELDERLIKTAESLTGEHEMNNLMRAGLLALIERESAQQLAVLGGSEPQLLIPPRRREIID